MAIYRTCTHNVKFNKKNNGWQMSYFEIKERGNDFFTMTYSSNGYALQPKQYGLHEDAVPTLHPADCGVCTIHILSHWIL